MSKQRKHAVWRPTFTAEDATRLALGAYYRAVAQKPLDGPELIGHWMLAISNRLQGDLATLCDYAEIIRRWEQEENAPLPGLKMQGLPPTDNRADNQGRTGGDNG